MKCLNCGAANAHEVNVTVNVSYMVLDEELEPDEGETLEPEDAYTGDTEYAFGDDQHYAIGSYCYACKKATLRPGWEPEVTKFVGKGALQA